MSPSAYITKRQTEKSGPRWVVRYRRGGKFFPLIHAGSFKTLKEARARRDFVAGELAAGRDPMVALKAETAKRRTLLEWFGLFIDSRIDVAESTVALYGNARAKLGRLAMRDPQTITPSDLQAWVADNANLKPKTVKHYFGSIRQVLEFADVEPNPAKSPKVKLPAKDQTEVSPPNGSEWKAIVGKLPMLILLALRFMECEGLRISEVLQLTYGDIDFADGRIRVSRARTKGGSAGQRWLPVPDDLMDEIDALVPLEDRHAGRFVFNLTEGQLRGGLERTCKLAGVAHYHPHDLRHRRISLWVAHGIDPVTVKTWAGHTRASMSLDVYSHVVIDRASDEWRKFWIDVYMHEREARVRSGIQKRGVNPHE